MGWIVSPLVTSSLGPVVIVDSLARRHPQWASALKDRPPINLKGTSSKNLSAFNFFFFFFFLLEEASSDTAKSKAKTRMQRNTEVAYAAQKPPRFGGFVNQSAVSCSR